MVKSQLSEPLTFRMPLDVLVDIEKIALVSDRNRSWVIVRALKTYLAGEGADILAIAKSREQIATGDINDAAIVEIDSIVNMNTA